MRTTGPEGQKHLKREVKTKRKKIPTKYFERNSMLATASIDRTKHNDLY